MFIPKIYTLCSASIRNCWLYKNNFWEKYFNMISVIYQKSKCHELGSYCILDLLRKDRFILTIRLLTGILQCLWGFPSLRALGKKKSHHDRHHVGHQPFMKAPLLGTLSSRHLLCPSPHRGGDPKTVFFSEPRLTPICNRVCKHKWTK